MVGPGHHVQQRMARIRGGDGGSAGFRRSHSLLPLSLQAAYTNESPIRLWAVLAVALLGCVLLAPLFFVMRGGRVSYFHRGLAKPAMQAKEGPVIVAPSPTVSPPVVNTAAPAIEHHARRNQWVKGKCKLRHHVYWILNVSGDLPRKPESFTEVINPDNTVSLRTSFGKYVATKENGEVHADSHNSGDCESFMRVPSADGSIAFQATGSVKYLSVQPDGSVRATGATVGPQESFYVINHADGTFSLRNVLLGKLLSVIWPPNMRMVIHNSARNISGWETFRMIRLRHDAVALQTYHHTYVTANSDGLMLANQADLDKDGIFHIESVENNKVALKTSFGKYVTAQENGTVYADGTTLSGWEAFEVVTAEDGDIALRTFHNTYLTTAVSFIGDAGAWNLREAGVSAAELTAAGYTEKELKQAGYKSKEVHRYGFLSTTAAPKEENQDKVACMQSQAWKYTDTLPMNVGMDPEQVVLPDRQQWDEIWDGLMSNSSGCDAPLKATMQLADGSHGFGSDMNNFVNELLVAMYTGRPITLCSPIVLRNLWSENFLNPGLPRCTSCSPPPKDLTHVEPMLWMHGAATSMIQAGRHPNLLEGLKRFLYRKAFALRPSMENLVMDLVQQLGLNDKYVGVHIRRGDKRQEAGFFRITAEFVANARDLCQAIGARRIFLASDDADEFDKFRAMLPVDIDLVQQPRLAPETYAERGALDGGAETVLLMDLALLIRADGYVGTASSNLDRFIWFQRDPATQSISLDDGGSFLYRSC